MPPSGPPHTPCSVRICTRSPGSNLRIETRLQCAHDELRSGRSEVVAIPVQGLAVSLQDARAGLAEHVLWIRDPHHTQLLQCARVLLELPKFPSRLGCIEAQGGG